MALPILGQFSIPAPCENVRKALFLMFSGGKQGEHWHELI